MPGKQPPEAEILARVRRVETRLTQLMVALGVDTRSQKPVFESDHGYVVVPSKHTSLREILDSVPDSWRGSFRVFIGSELLATLECAPLGT